MYSMINTILPALHAAAFIILSSQSKIHVVASPVPVSPTHAYYHARTNLEAIPNPNSVGNMGLGWRDISTEFRSSSRPIAAHSSTTPSLHRRDELQRYYNEAKENRNKLQSLSRQSASVEHDDDNYRRSCVTQLSTYQSNILGIEKILAQLGSGKGLAFYDPKSNLQTMLKNTVDLNKDVLSSVTEITYNIPALGPVLGPIVYEIKCILDDVLNITENLTDGLLNALAPVVDPLAGSLVSRLATRAS